MKYSTVNQVAAFEKLVGICNDLGARYNPSKAALTPTALATLLEQAQQSVAAVNVARINFMLAINSRQDMYASVLPLAARIVRALAAAEISTQNVLDARMIKRKLSSRPAVKRGFITTEGGEVTAESTSGHVSQLDYTSRADTFASLVRLIQELPSYAPNEPELQVTALHEFAGNLRTASGSVTNSANALSSARIHRNQVLRGKDGMFETASAVKDYIRSVFGVSSEVAKELAKLKLSA